MRQNPGSVNALATKMYEDRLKLPLQRDSLDDAAMKVGILVRFLTSKGFCYFFLYFVCKSCSKGMEKTLGSCWTQIMHQF